MVTTERQITYGCAKKWHDRCHRPDCECECHEFQQLQLDTIGEEVEVDLLARARTAARSGAHLRLIDGGR